MSGKGTYGQSAVSLAGWTASGEIECTNTFHIYCFEIPATQ
jgi:hypothetical protein